MDEDRERLYRELRSEVGNTPLVMVFGEPDPRGNIILAKLESEARWGGHYDRVYPELFYDFESRGRIRPGRTRILETSTGNAGISTAAVGRWLGYETHLGVPVSIDQARKDAIREHGGIVHEVLGDYVNAFPNWIREFREANRGTVLLNHSMGHVGPDGKTINNETTLRSLESIADEAIEQVKDVAPKHSRIDIYVAGVGNGSTVLGPGLRFRRYGAKVYGAEPVSSAVLFDSIHPWVYEHLYGVNFGSMPRHDVYGLSYPGIDFPHIRNSVGIAMDSVLVGDKRDIELLQANYQRSLTSMEICNNGQWVVSQRQLPRWDTGYPTLNRILTAKGYNPVGRSSAVGFAAALELSGRVENSTILFLCYDQLKRYDMAVQKAA